MTLNLKDKLDDLYEDWLQEEHTELIHNHEDLNELFCSDTFRDEFNEALKDVM